MVLALALLTLGRRHALTELAQWARDQLLMGADQSVLRRAFYELLTRVGLYRHQTLLGTGLLAYALVEGTEGWGLYLHRRWAEYLTVLATAFLIPYEVDELLRHPTLLKAAALLLNLAVVGWLAYKKRLFLDI